MPKATKAAPSRRQAPAKKATTTTRSSGGRKQVKAATAPTVRAVKRTPAKPQPTRVDADWLADALMAAAPHASVDVAMPTLAAVQVKVMQAGKLWVHAGDGQTAVRIGVNGSTVEAGSPFAVLLSRHDVLDLATLLDRHGRRPVTLATEQDNDGWTNLIVGLSPKVSRTLRCLPGARPDVDETLSAAPTSGKLTKPLIVEHDLLVRFADAASQYSGTGRIKLVAADGSRLIRVELDDPSSEVLGAIARPK